MRPGQGEDGTDSALETATEADAGNYGADEEASCRPGGQGNQGDDDSHDQSADPCEHDGAWCRGTQHKDRHHGDSCEDGQAESAQNRRVGSGQSAHQRGPEGTIQSGKCPDGKENWHRGKNRGSSGARHCDLWFQGGQRPRLARHGLGQGGNTDSLDEEDCQEHQVDQVCPLCQPWVRHPASSG